MKKIILSVIVCLFALIVAQARHYKVESITTYLGGSHLMDITAKPENWTAEADEHKFAVKKDKDEVLNFVFTSDKSETLSSVKWNATEVYSALKCSVEMKQQKEGLLIVVCKFGEDSEFVYKLTPTD